CRVPIPWTAEGTSYGFGAGGSWLPQPATWGALSVEAQTGDPGSTLEMYRSALALRRGHPALGSADNLRWLPSPDGVLVFERTTEGGPAFVCTVNVTGRPVTVDTPGKALITSAPTAPGSTHTELPADSTVWWTTA
ncbi:DUF3459 domain-containing protein, partial [Streptomyces sp. NPDC003444]